MSARIVSSTLSTLSAEILFITIATVQTVSFVRGPPLHFCQGNIYLLPNLTLWKIRPKQLILGAEHIILLISITIIITISHLVIVALLIQRIHIRLGLIQTGRNGIELMSTHPSAPAVQLGSSVPIHPTTLDVDSEDDTEQASMPLPDNGVEDPSPISPPLDLKLYSAQCIRMAKSLDIPYSQLPGF